MSYDERSTNLASTASVAALILSDPDCMDLELLMLQPRRVPESELAHLATVWHGRNLRSIGIIGLVGATPQTCLKEPLEPGKVSRIADAFLAYLQALFCDGFAQQLEEVEIAGLEKLYRLGDHRPEA